MEGALARLSPTRTQTRRIPRKTAVALVVLGVLAVAAFVADRALDEPMRRTMERQINERLTGYSAGIGKLDFHLFGLSIDLDDLVLVQDSHPDPPVLRVRRLSASVLWRALLRLRLVADLELQSPSLHADLVQLRAENRDDVAIDERGWQHALEAIYPLKIDRLVIHDGALEYRGETELRPLRASRIEAVATNIRNIDSPDRKYPSPIQLEGKLFDAGTVRAAGQADFLAEPHAGAQAHLVVEGVELDYFDPILKRYGLDVKKGTFRATGDVELAPGVQVVDVESADVAGASVDYQFGVGADARASAAAKRVGAAARRVMNEAEYLFRVRHLAMADATIGFVNRATSPAYRVFVDQVALDIDNLSSRAADGACEARLRAAFMGTGKVDASATFLPEGKSANFRTKVAVAETALAPLNDLLRAHGGIDVVGGVVSVYTDIAVKDGRIEGYVKPLFHDVDVYDPAQDEKKGFFTKLKEKIAGGLSTVLENQPRDEVATVVTVDGPVENPDSSTMEIVVNLVRNAFVEAILPGFLEKAHADDPARRLDEAKEMGKEKEKEKEKGAAG